MIGGRNWTIHGSAAITPIMTVMTAKKLPKVSERVANDIRRLIASGELANGDELGSEDQLIRRFGASRPSIRESVRILETEGLLSVVRGARTVRVQSPTMALPARYIALVLHSQKTSIADAYRARTLLEPSAVRELVRNADAGTIAALHAIVDKEAAAINDPIAFSHLTVLFHEEITRLSNNKTTHLLLTMLRTIFEAHFESYVSTSSVANFQRAVKAHRAFIRYVEQGNAEEAEKFWSHHLEMVELTMADSPGFHDVVELR